MTCSHCVEVEEKCARLELARDNALTMGDEKARRTADVRKSAGRRIGALLVVIDKLCQEVPEATRQWARGQVRDVLSKDGS